MNTAPGDDANVDELLIESAAVMAHTAHRFLGADRDLLEAEYYDSLTDEDGALVSDDLQRLVEQELIDNLIRETNVDEILAGHVGDPLDWPV
jgi:hypothetical protein